MLATGIRPRWRLHRRPPPRLGREAGRRSGPVSADGARARRQDDLAFHRHGHGQRRIEDVCRRRRRHVSEEHGRQADVDRRSRVEFAGYGLDAPGAAHMDYRGKDVKNAVVVWLGASGPKGLDPSTYRRALTGRAATRPSSLGAAASNRTCGAGGGRSGGTGRRRRVRARQRQRADGAARRPLPPSTSPPYSGSTSRSPPNVIASEAFFEFLFSAAPAKYAELKRRATAQEPLPSFRPRRRDAHVRHRRRLSGGPHAAHPQRGRRSIEGSDAQLKNTYVAFGAHYDHVGYSEGEVARRRRRRPPRAARRAASRRRRETIASGTAPTTMGREPWR